jgi:vacuolar-type H+-ATPase subunit F/Vma7
VKLRLHALARAGLAEGLGLAGIPFAAVASVEEGAERLGELVLAAAPQALLVEESLVDAMSPAARRRLARQTLPIVLSVPGPARALGGSRADEEVLEILRRAVGYRLRLR